MTKTLVRVDITPNPCSNEVRIASGRTFPGIRGDWTGVDMDWNTGKARPADRERALPRVGDGPRLRLLHLQGGLTC
jgi:hypothetical protein